MKINYKNISEEYIKTIDKMKKNVIDSSISGADRIRRDTKAIMLQDRIQSITDDNIYDNIWSHSQALSEKAQFVVFTNKIKSDWSDIDYRIPYHFQIFGCEMDISNGIEIIRTNSSIDLNIIYEIRIDHIDGLRVIAELTRYTRQQIRDGLPFKRTSKSTDDGRFFYNLNGLVEHNYEIDYVYACQQRLKENNLNCNSFRRSSYYEDPRPLLKFFLDNDKRRHIAMAAKNMKTWLTTTLADSNTSDGVPFNIAFYIKNIGSGERYMFYSTKTGYDKYYLPEKIDESYIKTVDTLKKDLDKKSTADDIRKHAKKIYISDIVDNCDINSIYAVLLSVFRRNQNTSAAIQGGYKPKVDVKSDIIDFYILSSDYINSNYFNCRLVNCFWTLDEDINDLITKTETSVKIVLKYSGEMEIVREGRDDMIRGFDEPYMISARSRSPWPNPEIEYIQLDIDNLREYLENMFPGIPFDVEVDMQYREGDDFNWTKKHFTLARSYSDVDDCIQKYKEANNL